MKRLLCLLMLSGVAAGQSEYELRKANPHPDWIRVGAQGAPTTVKDLLGNWSAAIEVYSDKDVSISIPDIQMPENVRRFAETGKYYAILYYFYRTEEGCRHLVYGMFQDDAAATANCKIIRYRRRVLDINTEKRSLTSREETLISRDMQPIPPFSTIEEKEVFPFAQIKSSATLAAIPVITAILRQAIAKAH